MSTSEFFLASRSQIEQLLPLLRLQRKEDWQSVYLDPVTGLEWIKYHIYEYHGSGPICLRLGNPSLSQVLACIGSSENDAEVSAAAYYLANDLVGKAENLAPLIDHLVSLLSLCSSPRLSRNIALAIAWSGVDRPFNHRDPQGKAIGQVNADFCHFTALAERSITLKAQAETLIGQAISQKSTSFE